MTWKAAGISGILLKGLHTDSQSKAFTSEGQQLGGDIDIQEKTELYDLRVRAGGKATIAPVLNPPPA